MQNPQRTVGPGDVVYTRRQRWRVVDLQADGLLRLLTLSGIGPSNSAVVRQVISPFDIVERVVPATRAKRAAARRWRATLKSLIAATAPPGSLRALSGTSIDLLPHQLEPALAVVRGATTRVLLADDVGLGKTIEAALILAELQARGAVTRALLLTPAGLRRQWQDELRRRFAIDAVIADAAWLRASAARFGGGINPWQACEVAIASMDLAKRPEHLAWVLACGWDLLIVDEAHHAVGDSDRQAAVSAIAARTPYVVLVTATPHNGSRTEFAALCSIGEHDDTLAVFRRTRSDVHIAIGRRAHCLFVAPTPAEARMHRALAAFTQAVRRERRDSNQDVWLALTVLNKRALSSAAALQRTVARRLASLKASIDAPTQWMLPLDDHEGELDVGDAAPEWIGVPALGDPGRERRLLAVVERAAADAARAGESKLLAIGRWLRRVAEPVIIFTEYRDTLDHVAGRLPLATLQLHGGLSAAERTSVLASFGSGTGPRILLATDAAGEGLNLHDRCRIVVNLELPWNPTRLEQRIGRVDRIGQRRTVHALALVGKATAEERILRRLRRRIAVARQDVRGADPFRLVTESEIEQLVIANEEPAEPAEAATCFTTLSLVPESRKEVERVEVQRRIPAPASGGADRDTCLIGAVHGWRARAHLGRTLLIVCELTLEDGCGRSLERSLVTLRVDAGARAVQLATLLATSPAALLTGHWFDACRAAAESCWRRFATARLQRERSIASALERDAHTCAVEPGLFDRRAERALAATVAAHEAAMDVAIRRTGVAAMAAQACVCRIAVRLVLRGAP